MTTARMPRPERIVPLKVWLTPDTHRALLPHAKAAGTTVSDLAGRIVEQVTSQALVREQPTTVAEPRPVRLRLDSRKRQVRVTTEMGATIRRMYAERYSVDEIAAALNVSVRTVYNHANKRNEEQEQ